MPAYGMSPSTLQTMIGTTYKIFWPKIPFVRPYTRRTILAIDTFDYYVLQSKQYAQMLGYNEGQVLELFKMNLYTS